MRILLSRTDRIGDVALALPMAGAIKSTFPTSEVLFLCRSYTEPVAKKNELIDLVVPWQSCANDLPEADWFIHVFPDKQIAWSALRKGYAYRAGTSHRLHHWLTCNRLIHFSRRRSPLHESQLNFSLLKAIGIKTIPAVGSMHHLVHWKFSKCSPIPLDTNKFKLIFHMKSLGSGKEWAMSNYLELAKMLPEDQFQILLTGTKAEGALIQDLHPAFFDLPNLTDLTGKLSLEELMAVIEHCDGLLASGTGPLHLAGLAGIKTLGLFPIARPIDAGRWAPLGPQVEVLCEAIPNNQPLLVISLREVFSVLVNWVS